MGELLDFFAQRHKCALTVWGTQPHLCRVDLSEKFCPVPDFLVATCRGALRCLVQRAENLLLAELFDLVMPWQALSIEPLPLVSCKRIWVRQKP